LLQISDNKPIATVGHVFNAVLVDGTFGIFTNDAASAFDVVTVRTDDPAFIDAEEPLFAAALMASTAPLTVSDDVEALTQDELDLVVSEAINRWTDSGLLTDDQLVQLGTLNFMITDLEGLTLGRQLARQVGIGSYPECRQEVENRRRRSCSCQAKSLHVSAQ
jgi:hypothetical protein